MNPALLALAVRFALGGRRALLRTALIALGTGLAAALLLLAVSVPAAFAGRDARASARTPIQTDHPVPHALVLHQVTFTANGVDVVGGVAAPASGRVPLPPGVGRLPADGTMLVSPALRAQLAAPSAQALRARLPYRVVGTIGAAGLVGPLEPTFFATDSHLSAARAGTWTTGFGEPVSHEPLTPVLALIVVVGVLVLLLPIGVVVAIAARFGAERRDRRLAALRLLGAGSTDVTRLAVVEAAIAGVLGDLVGILVFVLGRQALGVVSILSLSMYPEDARPGPALAALILILVPAVAVAAALVSLRGGIVSPLGVSRRASPRRRRLRWRLVPVVLAAPLLVSSVGAFRADAGGSVPVVAGGVLLLLIGALALLPLIIERLAGRLSTGALSWQFATRRIQHGGSTASRVVGAVMVALAGAIALQMLFTGTGSRFSAATGVRADERVSSAESFGLDGRTAERWVRAATGAGRAIVSVSVPVQDPRRDGPSGTVLRADCATLRRIATLPSCVDGDVFTLSGRARALAGRKVAMVDGFGTTWRVPARSIAAIAGTFPGEGDLNADLLATPGALPLRPLHSVDAAAVLPTDRIAPLAAALTPVDPLVGLSDLNARAYDNHFASIQRGLTVGLMLVMLLIAGVLLVSIGEQLRERRRMLATLAAVGMPRGVLMRSILWESGLPIVIAVIVAVGTGLALGGVLLAIVSSGFAVDPALLAASAATGLAVPVVVTLLTLPSAVHRMRPEGLRTE